MSEEICSSCLGPIVVQIFKGSGVCCENCWAIRDGDFVKEGRH